MTLRPFQLVPGRSFACLVFFLLASLGKSSAQTQTSDDFANKSIEELMNIDVTSVSRKDQKLSKIPAAVYVITREAIKRSGSTNIPDLLRLAPGVQVAQVDANRWAISVRGFNGTYSNKLLVLIDGRTVYTPSFSGVYWDQTLEIPTDIIDRIEVIRGPGGTVWGANAVNGVINIITEHSSDTQGGKVSVGGGSSQTGDFLAEYGGKFKDSYSYRAYEQFDSFATRNFSDGQPGGDGWHSNHGGFRLDKGDDKTTKDYFLAEGNFYRESGTQIIASVLSSNGQTPLQPLNDNGFDVTARWTHNSSDRQQTSLQIYDNNYSRQDTGEQEINNTADLDFQDHIEWGSRNDVVLGAGYRYSSDKVSSVLSEQASFAGMGYFVKLNPTARDYSLFSTFFQDEIRVTSNLSFTAGSKLEHNAFSGFQYEPSLRLAWSPTATSTLWMAASQASRQPSRLETGLDVQSIPFPVAPHLSLNVFEMGNPQLQSERMRDYEIGYRVIPNDRISFDATSFFSIYRDLVSNALLQPSVNLGAGGLVATVPIQYENGAKSTDYGLELSSTWNVAPRWKLTGTYSWIRVLSRQPSITSDSGILGAGIPVALLTSLAVEHFGDSPSTGYAVPPENQAGLQSYVDLTRKLSFDGAVYFVGKLSYFEIPAYTRLDSHVTYQFSKHFEARLVGQNLLSPHHLEFGNVVQVLSTEVPRSIFGKIVWKF